MGKNLFKLVNISTILEAVQALQTCCNILHLFASHPHSNYIMIATFSRAIQKLKFYLSEIVEAKIFHQYFEVMSTKKV